MVKRGNFTHEVMRMHLTQKRKVSHANLHKIPVRVMISKICLALKIKLSDQNTTCLILVNNNAGQA